MRNNSNSVSSLQYHIVWCTKYRHPVLTGAVEVETKTILAQTCTEYGWTSTSFLRHLLMRRPLQ